jgi:hypothetical protein
MNAEVTPARVSPDPVSSASGGAACP